MVSDGLLGFRLIEGRFRLRGNDVSETYQATEFPLPLVPLRGINGGGLGWGLRRCGKFCGRRKMQFCELPPPP
ncbi:hypothetical protein HMPREF9120_02674, partial [Neisseria sp. oral taxon 020 str. F0370]